ncbi:hypothetical protein M1D80_00845 (plasmid) [Phyllobacteriaceae bacterium JZ32]
MALEEHSSAPGRRLDDRRQPSFPEFDEAAGYGRRKDLDFLDPPKCQAILIRVAAGLCDPALPPEAADANS